MPAVTVRSVVAAACLLLGATTEVAGQSVLFGSHEMRLGMSADSAVRRLERSFRLTANHGQFQTWTVVDSLGPSSFAYRGQIVASGGRVVSISKSFTPDRATPRRVGEAFFALLERVSADGGSSCTVTTTRSPMPVDAAAGGTMLSATITCARHEGIISVYQGGSASISNEPSITLQIQAPRPWRAGSR